MVNVSTSSWEVRPFSWKAGKCFNSTGSALDIVSYRTHRQDVILVYLKATAVTSVVWYKLSLSICASQVKIFSYRSFIWLPKFPDVLYTWILILYPNPPCCIQLKVGAKILSSPFHFHTMLQQQKSPCGVLLLLQSEEYKQEQESWFPNLEQSSGLPLLKHMYGYGFLWVLEKNMSTRDCFSSLGESPTGCLQVSVRLYCPQLCSGGSVLPSWPRANCKINKYIYI